MTRKVSHADKMTPKTGERTVRKILALSICLLLLPALAFADSDLLNYEKEAEVVVRGVCDNGKTQVTLYGHQEYDLDAVVTASGKTYLYFITNEGTKYYMKSGDSLVKMSHEAWDNDLKSASPGWYAYLHYGEDDCRKVN